MGFALDCLDNDKNRVTSVGVNPIGENARLTKAATPVRTFSPAFWLSMPLLAVYVFLLVKTSYWRYLLDLPLYLYTAFLVDQHGYVPYRDFFDPNSPGTHFFYWLAWLLTAGEDFRVRLLDIGWLLAIQASAWAWLRHYSPSVATLGMLLAGLFYLELGPVVILQREFLALLPVTLGIAVYFSNAPVAVRFFVVGALFGVAFTIKPVMGIGLGALALTELHAWLRQPAAEKIHYALERIPAVMIGFSVPLLVGLAYLYYNGALADFLSIYEDYWPLYMLITGQHQAISEAEYPTYLVRLFFRLVDVSALLKWVLPLVAIFLVYRKDVQGDARRDRIVLLLFYLLLAYGIYPVITGKAWVYHRIPFLFFAAFMFAVPFGTVVAAGKVKLMRIALCTVVALILAAGAMHSAVLRPEMGEARPFENNLSLNRVDRLARDIADNLRPGDRVQPMDWTGGALHAMLKNKAEIGTRFMFDIQFYHHGDREAPQRWRKVFLKELRANRPAMVVIMKIRAMPTGDQVFTDFPEFQDYLRNYHPVVKNKVYEIWRIDDSPGHAQG